MDRYTRTKQFILDKLEKGLPQNLYYHSYNHVLDVLEAADRLGEKEGIPETELELLRVAVLFHDSGYIISSKEHESLSCQIAKEDLPSLGYEEKEIECICSMIMATRYPQQPSNKLEEIICDADLDYLGRDDFFKIGSQLYRELNVYGLFADENDWNKFQESFLSKHHYFTKSAKEMRENKKNLHLKKIRESLNK
ncbi:MAG: HD domain-containing protein [Bacteroidetes bacterium]|nr:MAG: HD domain-containing protein [Bacteroidota bacterium]REK08147.1 MAG: HD domain-containing protein [Bacteroidota bacterium]REK32352.1 MAG: HD domain-containing protein [Bacteroidota bacterium]REK49586.1 MAG: HD domain-containing protein [Bacteroidota bacterium]